MCGSFIISKVGSTIVGINNHDGTYTVTTKGKLPKDTSTETLNIDDIKSRYSEYLSLDSDTFEKKETTHNISNTSDDVFIKRKAEAIA